MRSTDNVYPFQLDSASSITLIALIVSLVRVLGMIIMNRCVFWRCFLFRVLPHSLQKRKENFLNKVLYLNSKIE